jgi:hypothetical protein
MACISYVVPLVGFILILLTPAYDETKYMLLFQAAVQGLGLASAIQL